MHFKDHNFVFIERFGIKPTVCETSPRKTPTDDLTEEEQENYYRRIQNEEDINQHLINEHFEYLPEISVKQSAY